MGSSSQARSWTSPAPISSDLGIWFAARPHSKGSAFTIRGTPTPALAPVAGLGLPIIGKLLGHSEAATTARYAHLDADQLKRASETIAGQIAAAMARDGAGAGAIQEPGRNVIACAG
jgi:hypothetical protein